MRKIAITGNIASGKTTVTNILLEKGYKVLDTDNVSHKLLENNQEVIKLFGEFDIFDNGTISRNKLAKIVFSDNVLLKKLESIIHPLVKEKIIEYFESNISENIVFVEIPLLFEANMQNLFDEIVFVYCDDDIRLNRLKSRNNLNEIDAQQRMNSQLNQDEKINKSKIIFYNNATLDELKKQVIKYF